MALELHFQLTLKFKQKKQAKDKKSDKIVKEFRHCSTDRKITGNRLYLII